ncbi:MAG TPA: enoyl-CoA hydratase-related protein, partial [Candidatus Acidoferrales bacterium]|nr:enoyl-CoA hydratase-related protein [Candidatus Acidoferrales bacterium]
ACELGLVTRVVADDALAQSVDTLLGELRALSPVVLRLSRRALRRDRQADFETQLEAMEQLYLGELMETGDAQEGIRAFLEKRAPAWRGR